MLRKQGCDNPILLDERTAGCNFEPLSIDFDRRDNIIVRASRNVHKQVRKEKSSNLSTATLKRTNTENLDVDSSEDGSDDGTDDDYSSASTDENSAYETCSEGSTNFQSDESGDELSEDSFEVDDSSSEPSEEDEDEEDSDPESEDSEADAKLKEPGPRRALLVLNYRQPTKNKLELEGDVLKQKKDRYRPTYPGLPGRFKDPEDRITATVAVYNIRTGQELRMFHYEHDIPAMLYDSPPVLHPHKALLVWPLGGGDVLFADYDKKTYFIRAMMPTTRDSESPLLDRKWHFFHSLTLSSPAYLHESALLSLRGLPPHRQRRRAAG